MKESALILLTFLLPTGIKAQVPYDGYHPFIEEGKEWEVAILDDSGITFEGILHYSMSGDTIILGRTCKKWQWEERKPDGKVVNSGQLPPVYEENKKVFFYPEWMDTPLLYFDFGAQEDDRFTTYDMNMPWCAEEITMGKHYWTDELYNQQCGRLPVYMVEGTPVALQEGWIEGVGYLPGPSPSYVPFSDGENGGRQTMLLDCRVNGNIIFRSRHGLRLTMLSDEDYRPFVEEGKEWILGGTPDSAHILDWVRIYKIEGDTMIAGTPCKKWNMRRYDYGKLVKEMALSPIYEENKKVFFFPDGQTEPLLFFDFGASANEEFTIYDIHDPGVSVTVSYPGVQWTTYLTGEECGVLPAYKLSSVHVMPWIVGVGYMGNPAPMYNPARMHDADKLDVGDGNLLACSVNGDVLFYGPIYFIFGFDKCGGITAIHDLPAQSAANSKAQVPTSNIYDLSGRRLSAPPAKGMYIQDKRVKIRE